MVFVTFVEGETRLFSFLKILAIALSDLSIILKNPLLLSIEAGHVRLLVVSG